MKVIYHIGVHATDNQKLVNCLHANGEMLARRGIIVPDPKVYRPMLREVMKAVQSEGGMPTPETEETVLDAMVVQDHVERLIFSNDAWFCKKQRILAQGVLYARAAEVSVALQSLLPSCEAELCLAIRNPATFLPAVLQSCNGVGYEDFMSGADPRMLSWSEMVGRIRAAAPDLPITLWCDEDTPLIWPEVLRHVSGYDGAAPLEGEQDLLASILSREGMARMRAYLAERPDLPLALRSKVVSAFLDKYALEDAIEIDIDLPGWDEALVEVLSD
ncbi:hypothetical protein FGG78_33885, partial [Thioclava sp. BHET1]